MSSRSVAALVCILLSVSGCSEPPEIAEPIRPLRVIEVGVVDDLRTGQLPGRARSAREVDLSFDVSGTVAERPVSIGDQVSEGDLIARLDARDFQARLKAAEADARNAQRIFERGRELLAREFISEAEMDRLEADVDISQAQLDLARKALSDSVIRAPFDGVISNLMVENFQSVPAKSTIARLLGTERIEMVINLSESQIANIALVENIEVVFDAYPDLRLKAEIAEIGTEASATTRTFPITLSMEQPESPKILAGMAGVAYGSGRFDPDASVGFVVPASAFMGSAEGNESTVWVVGEDNRVSRRVVRTGNLVPGGVTVLEGLSSGERVATAGVHTLKEGQQVRLTAAGSNS